MTSDLQIFNVPECFYNASHTNNLNTCDCDKIFFDVFIDFKKVRMIVCKDWYNMIFKNIKNEIPCDVDIKCNCYYKNDSQKIISQIVLYLIDTYLKTPIYEIMEYKKNCYVWGRYDFNMAITLCERPYLVAYINPFKFISWFLLSGGHHFLETYQIYNRAINIITAILDGKAYNCKSLDFKKYEKFKELLRKFKNSATSFDYRRSSELFNDVFNEYSKHFNN